MSVTAVSSVSSKNSWTRARTRTTSPGATSGPKLLSKTKMPSEVSGSPSASASSSWTKNPLNSSLAWKSPTTTPSTMMPETPSSGLTGPEPCTSLMSVAASPQAPKQSLALPGVPRSPAPNGVTDWHQFEPTALSRRGSSRDIEAPLGSGKVAPLSHSTRSASFSAVSSSTSSSLPLARNTPEYW